ncbi:MULTISPECIES: hypothetical protein [unclassified Micromonospora]|uniref:hypothetical protein n=1 Tax=unclassified Micromonospora TaxID=2617518 RepID=UPI003633845C
MTDFDKILDRLSLLVGWHADSRMPIEWPALVAAAGHDFPLDYRRYVERFPPGVLGALTVHHPQRWSGVADYLEYAENYHNVMNDRALMRGDFPYRFGSSPGDLYMWGAVQADYLLCWQLSEKAAEEWPTVVCDISMVDQPERYEGSFSNLLLELAEGKTPVPVISYVADGAWPFEFEAF